MDNYNLYSSMASQIITDYYLLFKCNDYSSYYK